MESQTVSPDIKDYIYSVDLTPTIDRLEKIDGWKRKYAIEACKQYRNYIFLRAKYGADSELPPSKEIDDVWHAHVLHTKDYFAFCDKIFGQYLHHNPHMEGGKHTIQELQRKFDEDTQELYRKEFGDYIYSVQPPSITEIAKILISSIVGLFTPRKLLNQHA